MMEPLPVPDNLDRHKLAGSMIAAAKHLSKRSFAKSADNFIPVGQMVMFDNKIVASIIVIAMIVGGICYSGSLLLTTGSDEIHRRVSLDFLAFVVRQVLRLAAVKDVWLTHFSSCFKKELSEDLPSGEAGLTGAVGSGNFSMSFTSSGEAPAASFLACCLFMYCIISSSPRISSSSTELGTGDGVESDCRLEAADAR
jgi:hypothetical protein